MQINDRVFSPLDDNAFGRVTDIMSFDEYDTRFLSQDSRVRTRVMTSWFAFGANQEDPVAFVELDRPRCDGATSIGCPTSLLNKLFFQCTCKEVKTIGTHSRWCDILRKSIGV